MAVKKDDKSTWATGGGFFFMPDVFAFVGSLIAGLGPGLILNSILSHKTKV